MKLVKRAWSRWRTRGDRFRYGRDRNTSAWDNTLTGADMIAVFIDADKTRKARKLP